MKIRTKGPFHPWYSVLKGWNVTCRNNMSTTNHNKRRLHQKLYHVAEGFRELPARSLAIPQCVPEWYLTLRSRYSTACRRLNKGATSPAQQTVGSFSPSFVAGLFIRFPSKFDLPLSRNFLSRQTYSDHPHTGHVSKARCSGFTPYIHLSIIPIHSEISLLNHLH